MFGRRRREERRIRQSGVPVRATIIDARPTGDQVPGGQLWEVRLHVSPPGSAQFTSVAEGVCAAGQTPALGAEIEVLHHAASGRRVLVTGLIPSAGAVSSAGTPPSELRSHSTGVAAGTDVVGQVLEAFGGGSGGDDANFEHRIVGATEVFVNGERVRVAGGPAPGAERLTNEQLKQLARTDPAGMAGEVLRRLASGEMVPQNVETNVQEIALDGQGAVQMLDALRQSGLLDDAQLEQIRRQIG